MRYNTFSEMLKNQNGRDAQKSQLGEMPRSDNYVESFNSLQR